MQLPKMLVVIEDDAPVERSLLVDLLERGPTPTSTRSGCRRCRSAPGWVWRSARPSREVRGDDAAVRRTQGDRARHRPRRCCHLTRLERFARELSPIVDIGARSLPRVRTSRRGPRARAARPLAAAPAERLLERWNLTSVDAEAARRRPPGRGRRRRRGAVRARPACARPARPGRWHDRSRQERVPPGVGDGARRARYSPRRVNFLFVDYKGGSAFSECVKLPHCVGLVTDLSPHLVDRALTSLRRRAPPPRASLRVARRQGHPRARAPRCARDAAGAGDRGRRVRRARRRRCPSSSTGWSNVAQRGRSLGLHLILATQRPAGVITGNLRANTNLRSRAAHGRRVRQLRRDRRRRRSVHRRRHTPGAASRRSDRAARSRSSRRSTADGRRGRRPSRQVTVRPLSIDDGRALDWPTIAVGGNDEPNDLARLVAAARRAALLGQVPDPRRPWLPELPDDLDLGAAHPHAVGRRDRVRDGDRPAQQAQPPIELRSRPRRQPRGLRGQRVRERAPC